MTFLCVCERASFKITLIWSDLEENRWIFKKKESEEVLISPNMPHKTFSGFDAANCQPQNHFPILFLYFQCFKVSQKSRRCRSCKPFPISPSLAQSICKVRATQLHSVQPGLYVLCAYSQKKRASINTQYVLIFLVPRSGAPTCWCWIMGWGCCIIILGRRWFAVCATNHIFSAYRQDTVARPA